MNVNYKNILTSIFIAVILTLAGLSSNPASALSASDQGIQISPALVEMNAERGSARTITLNVMNITTSDLVYAQSVVDFGSSDETGSPQIIEDSSLPESSSIRSWISSTPQFMLAAGDSKTITVELNVPANAEPGGHYGVLRFSGAAPELDTSGVGLSASAGVLILVRVDGDITETASLSSFYTSNNDKQSWFFENSPIDFVTRIKNDGNIHVKPTGSIDVTDMFGNVVSSIDINKVEPRSNVLPGSTRRFESTLDKNWMFGKYTANLVLAYGNEGQAITNTITFWVIPYKIILAILLALATIVFIISRIVKSHNKKIIAKYKNESKK